MKIFILLYRQGIQHFILVLFIFFFAGTAHGTPIDISWVLNGNVDRVSYSTGEFAEYVDIRIGDSFTGYLTGSYQTIPLGFEELFIDHFTLDIGGFSSSIGGFLWGTLHDLVDFDSWHLISSEGAFISSKTKLESDNWIFDLFDNTNTLFDDMHPEGNITMNIYDKNIGLDSMSEIELTLTSHSPQPVPEPATILLLTIGISLMCCMSRKKTSIAGRNN